MSPLPAHIIAAIDALDEAVRILHDDHSSTSAFERACIARRQARLALETAIAQLIAQPGEVAAGDGPTKEAVAKLVEALDAFEPGDMPCKESCGNRGGYNRCTCGMEAKRHALASALAPFASEATP